MVQILKLKHWKLFLLLAGPTILLLPVILIFVVKSLNLSLLPLLFPIVIASSLVVFLIWIYTLGVNLHKKLPIDSTLNLTKFRLFFFLYSAYSICFILFSSGLLGDHLLSPSSMGFMALGNFLSLFCFFNCIHFVSKALKTLEIGRTATFNDFIGDFVLIWFFPFGVWFIQPRVNKLFNESKEQTS